MLDNVSWENNISISKPVSERKRRLQISGTRNFRDLGGYRSADGRTVRWGVLYRSDHLHKLTSDAQKILEKLSLHRIVDFRAEHEKEREPDHIPAEMNGCRLEIPILDASTRVWHEDSEEFTKNLKNIDPAQYMIQTNVEFASVFTPEIKRFFQELLMADGKPILFHCAVGKDRTGFTAAIILRMLGVPHETVMQDYLLTNEYMMPTFRWNLQMLRLMKGKAVAAAVRGFMEARPEYLNAAFETIDRKHGSFENYLQNGLSLTPHDIERLKNIYLE